MSRPRIVVVLCLVLSASCDAASRCVRGSEEELKCVVDSLQLDDVDRRDSVKILTIECSERSSHHDELDTEFLQSFSRLRSLTIERCKLSNIGEEVFVAFPSLKELRIRTFNAEWSPAELRLAGGCFRGLERVETLDLSDNNLWSISPDVFDGLSSLKVLNVSGNNLHDISELQAVTKISDSVHVVDASRNSLQDLPRGGLSSFVDLRKLHVNDNDLSIIQDGALRGLQSLEMIELSSNKLVALPAMMLNETPALRELFFQSNNISVLPPGLLADLPQLVSLNMSHNQINSQWIKRDTFGHLFRLIVLDISSNKLDTLSSDVFQDLVSLQVLRLSDNHLETVSSGLFSTMRNLHTLSLSGNKFRRVHQELMTGLHVLNRLSFSDNQINEIDPETFNNVTSIQELRLEGNRLQLIPEGIIRLTNLRRLDLGDNELHDVSGQVFQQLRRLSYLRLAGNRLTEVPSELTSTLTSLTMLDLSRNAIIRVQSGAFNTTAKLKAIRLDTNQLTNINGLFAKMTSLLWLNVSDNQIGFFDYALIPSQLLWLDLRRNKIKEIGNFYGIHDKIQLETLDVSDNEVSHVGASSVPDSIKYFILSANQLATVEAGTFESKVHLVRADLSANQLSQLNLNSIVLPEGLEETAQLLLAGNPFFCDCEMDWLLNIDSIASSRKYPKVVDADQIMCRFLSSPNRPVHLQHASPSNFLCSYERHCFALCHCCNYVACDCEMRCPDGCSCYHDHAWSTNIVDCRRRDLQAISRSIPMDATSLLADGNVIHSLESHTFIGRQRLQVLQVNGSGVQDIQNRSLNGLVSLQVLRLQDNLIKELRGDEFSALQSLEELYLHNNQLTQVHPDSFERLRSLKVLTLRGNQLTSFPVWRLTVNPYLVEISLAGNPWSCQCTFLTKLTQYVDDNRAKLEDAGAVQCIYDEIPPKCDGTQLHDSFPRQRTSGNAVSLAMIAVTVLAAAALVTVCLIYRYRARVCVRKHPPSAAERKTSYMETATIASVSAHAEKLYDVFVTYSSQDTHFVNDILAPMLENTPPSFRLCLLRRDSPSVSYLGDAVRYCVQASRKTVLVISPNFLESEWCRFDFKASHLEALRGTRDIVAILHGVDRSSIDGELKTMLKGAAFVTYGERDFWRKLRTVLPPCRQLKSTMPHSFSDQSYVSRALFPRGMSADESPSPTCSTVVSEERSLCASHFRSHSHPQRRSQYGRLPQHNASSSMSEPSEHLYMTIDQYQTAAGALQESELYSTLEPEVQPRLFYGYPEPCPPRTPCLDGDVRTLMANQLLMHPHQRHGDHLYPTAGVYPGPRDVRSVDMTQNTAPPSVAYRGECHQGHQDLPDQNNPAVYHERSSSQSLWV